MKITRSIVFTSLSIVVLVIFLFVSGIYQIPDGLRWTLSLAGFLEFIIMLSMYSYFKDNLWMNEHEYRHLLTELKAEKEKYSKLIQEKEKEFDEIIRKIGVHEALKLLNEK